MIIKQSVVCDWKILIYTCNKEFAPNLVLSFRKQLLKVKKFLKKKKKAIHMTPWVEHKTMNCTCASEVAKFKLRILNGKSVSHHPRQKRAYD